MRFLQDSTNLNGKVQGGASVKLQTAGSNDDTLTASPVGVGGISAAFEPTPPPVPGMALRFRGDALTGSDGSAVTLWPDISGNNAAALTAAGVPVLKTGANGINGHQVVRIVDPGSGGALACYLQVSNVDMSSWPGLSIYFVARTPPAGKSRSLAAIVSWDATGQKAFFGVGTSTDAGAGGTTGGDLGGVDGYADNTTYVGSYRYDKTAWTLEGVRSGTKADTSFPSGTVNLWIGSYDYPVGSQSNSDIGEIIIYKRVLSDDEDAALLAWLNWQYRNHVAPASDLRIGYGDTLTNLFVERYAHPAGSDTDPRNDGKTWQTAKATILAAWDSAAAEMDPDQRIEINAHDLCYMGGESENNGLWLYDQIAIPGAGWRQYRPHKIIGYGGVPAGRGFTPSKARIYQGHPGDSQAFDKTKPLIWITGGNTESTIENIRPYRYGFARLGVQALSGNVTGDRDGNLENVFWTNVQMISPPDTAPVFGPAFDCGWVSEAWFNWCQATGSSTYTTIAHAAGDNASGTTITLGHGNFDATLDVGGYLTIDSGLNPGQWFIDAVLSSTQVTVHGAAPLVSEFFGTYLIQKSCGPQVIDDDDHAGWLFRPTDIKPPGTTPGSMGYVTLVNPSFQQCGIKYYIGNSGEVGLEIHRFISEGGPMPHPVQVAMMPGATVPSLVGPYSQVIVDGVILADGYQFDTNDLYIAPETITNWGTANIRVQDIGGTNAPGLWTGNDIVQQNSHGSPNSLKQWGWFWGGRISGSIEAARTVGAPVTALATSTGGAGNPPNLLSQSLTGPGAWSAAGGGIMTSGTTGRFGLPTAADLSPGVSGYLAVPMNPDGVATITLADGDMIVFGIAARALTPGSGLSATPGPLNTPIMNVGMASGTGALTAFSPASGGPSWRGNGEWQWCRGALSYSGTGATTALAVQLRGSSLGITHRFDAATIVAVHLKVSEGYSREYASELLMHLAPWNAKLAQGVAGTSRGQAFVASGGIGVGAAQLVVPSGSATNTKNVALLSDDGRTVQGYLPILPTNAGLQALITWPTVDEVVVSTGTGPIGYSGLTYTQASGLLKVAGTVELDLVTASKIVATDASKQLVPVTVDAPMSYAAGHLSTSTFIASGASHAAGLVPDPGSTAGTAKLLREDSTWTDPPVTATMVYMAAFGGGASFPLSGYLYTSSNGAPSSSLGGVRAGEVCLGLDGRSVRLVGWCVQSSLAAGVGNWTLKLVRNSVVEASVLFVNGSAGAFDTGDVTLAGVPVIGDTYGLYFDSGGGMTALGSTISVNATILVKGT